jgi:glucokinase
MDPIVKALNENVMSIWVNKVKVLTSTLKDSDAAILGASSLAWDIEAQAPMSR